jgi:hypothetical protein
VAADLFIDAALVAREQRDIEGAVQLGKRADCRSRSPFISPADARWIRRRLGTADRPVFAVQ